MPVVVQEHSKNVSGTVPTLSEDKASVKPVQRRLLVPLAAVMLLLVVGFGAIMITVQQKSIKRSSRDKLAAVTYDLKEFLGTQSEMLSALEDVLLRDANLTDALKTQDRDRLLADYEPLLAQLRARHGVTHFYFQGIGLSRQGPGGKSKFHI